MRIKNKGLQYIEFRTPSQINTFLNDNPDIVIVKIITLSRGKGSISGYSCPSGEYTATTNVGIFYYPVKLENENE